MTNNVLDEWDKEIRITLDDNNNVAEYTVQLYKKLQGGWYDEVRYESHEKRKSKQRPHPHLHIKTKTPFKAVRELSDIENELVHIIEKILPELKGL